MIEATIIGACFPAPVKVVMVDRSRHESFKNPGLSIVRAMGATAASILPHEHRDAASRASRSRGRGQDASLLCRSV